jgi:hypothetical protein
VVVIVAVRVPDPAQPSTAAGGSVERQPAHSADQAQQLVMAGGVRVVEWCSRSIPPVQGLDRGLARVFAHRAGPLVDLGLGRL